MAIATLTSNETGANSLIDINANFVDLDTTKADLASPTFTGTPTLPTGTTGVTQIASDNSTKIATTAYVDTQVNSTVFSGARVTTAGGTITSTTAVTVDWNGETYDTDTYHDNVTNNSRLTAPTTSKYLISANLKISCTDSSIMGLIQLKVNGTTVIAQSGNLRNGGVLSNDDGIGVSTVYALTAGDYVEVITRWNYGSNNITYSSSVSNFSMTKLR